MKGESVRPAAPCPRATRSCSEPRPLHTRPARSGVTLANIPTDPWQPLRPTPLWRDLLGLPTLLLRATSNWCLTPSGSPRVLSCSQLHQTMAAARPDPALVEA